MARDVCAHRHPLQQVGFFSKVVHVVVHVKAGSREPHETKLSGTLRKIDVEHPCGQAQVGHGGDPVQVAAVTVLLEQPRLALNLPVLRQESVEFVQLNPIELEQRARRGRNIIFDVFHRSRLRVRADPRVRALISATEVFALVAQLRTPLLEQVVPALKGEQRSPARGQTTGISAAVLPCAAPHRPTSTRSFNTRSGSSSGSLPTETLGLQAEYLFFRVGYLPFQLEDCTPCRPQLVLGLDGLHFVPLQTVHLLREKQNLPVQPVGVLLQQPLILRSHLLHLGTKLIVATLDHTQALQLTLGNLDEPRWSRHVR
mmetsp:Transcript_6885/g.16765  ORF Transcript_6885/g.16765 Transcript_6885/m.16765 type:complete len:314 (-) Transcript_6885:165-1106(-)